MREHLDPVPVDDERVAFDLDFARELAVHGVVAGEMRVGLGTAEIVQRDDGEIVLLGVFVVRTQDVAADAAVAVDGDFDGHVLKFLEKAV